MEGFLTVADLPVSGCRVLLRSDLNVPLRDGKVADDFRLRATLPAIEQLRQAGAAVILCSHLGRPRGRVVEGMRMAPVARALSELGGFPVAQASDSVGADAGRMVGEARPGDVVLLENTRFHPGETTNDPGYSSQLAALADFFVLDAFGSAHRAHASTSGVSALIRSGAGPLLERELAAFQTLTEKPPRPFTVVLGGAKISDKLPLVRALLPKVDALLIGGGMCFSLLAAEGYEVGNSLVEPDCFDSLRELLSTPAADRLVLPYDIVTADRFDENAGGTAVGVNSIEEGAWGLDIGPATAEQFAEVIGGSGSVFWNGPMGVFEWEAFRAGTATVAAAMARSSGFRVAGGGDSVAALRILGRQDDLDHLSTGGGAGLEMLEGMTLPGVKGLERWAR